MPGIPTKLAIADLVFDKLNATGSPHATLLQDPAYLPFAYLGAIGSCLGDVLPARPDLGGGIPNTRYFRAWRPLLRLLAGWPADPNTNTPEQQSVARALQQLAQSLSKLANVVGNHDKFGLIGMKSELEGLDGVMKIITDGVSSLQSIRNEIGLAIFLGGPDPKVPPATGWEPAQALKWSRTGRHLKNLQDLAEAAGDKRMQAYALGARVGYAADLVGNPFINSIVRGPFRNDWWRHRWVSAYVDAWVHGYYGLGGASNVQMGSNGVPNPGYTTWPNLCSARLHDKITVGGIDSTTVMQSLHDSTAIPAMLPPEFVTFWLDAFKTTYDAHPAGMDEDGLQSAYAITWLLLWLQTSGEVFPCMPADQINYPDNCGDRPPWVAADGSVPGSGGQSQVPPAPTNTSPNWAEIVSGILLAIVGIIGVLAGGVVPGIAAIVAAIVLIVDGATEPDWDALTCYVGWVLAYYYNMMNALHDLFKWSGFGYPYAYELAHNEIYHQLTGQVTPPDAALNTAFSLGFDPDYPRQKWIPISSSWCNPPTEPLEPQAVTAYRSSRLWPAHFADGLAFTPGGPPAPPPTQTNPLVDAQGTPVVRNLDEWKLRRLNLGKTYELGFGNAVDISLDLIEKAATDELLDWDLDGDPGLGAPTWVLPTPTTPRSGAIPEP